jgi:hypothetical protein
MGDTRDTISGIAVLTNDRTGEVMRVAVLIACDDESITYTAQSIDRTRRASVTWRRSDCPAFQEMMDLVARVNQSDRMTA